MNDHLIFTEPVSGDGPNADYRVLWGHDDSGVHIGYLVDLALDEDALPGTQGFDAFTPNGEYVGYGRTMESAGQFLVNGSQL